jgi:ParB-like chromosome segregation protein Spo0J
MALNMGNVKKTKADKLIEAEIEMESQTNSSKIIHSNLNSFYDSMRPIDEENSQIRKLQLSQLVEHDNNEYLFGGLDDDSIANLQEGIKKDGLTGTLIVWDIGNGKYEIASGHRRYRALKNLDYKGPIYCWVSECPQSKDEKDRQLIYYNIHSRGSISAASNGKSIYITRQISRLKEILDHQNFTGNKAEKIAFEFNCSKRTIDLYSSLETCTEKVLDAESEGIITLNIASSLHSLNKDDQDKIIDFLRSLYKEGCSIKEIQYAAKELRKNVSDNNIEKLQKELISEIAISNMISNIDEVESKYESLHKTYKKKDIYTKSIDTFTRFERKVLPILKEENSFRKQELIEKLKDIIDSLES